VWRHVEFDKEGGSNAAWSGVEGLGVAWGRLTNLYKGIL